MLDNETKRRIDTARDILVGKIPDPKSQVEQITIALIYKFMDDMDKEAKELGGNASFFSSEFEKYSWSGIFDPKLGGHDLINLYSEALEKINQNPNIPELFRNIFKNAYLPYKDPETLKSFLKIINYFTYEHSEKLGDAFEYLLSVLGSQGDAGQFRTPRHIIDFIVDVIEPQKNETILDPSCGTAGFLISSYKYILKDNSSIIDLSHIKEAFEEKGLKQNEVTLENPKNFSGDKLNPDEKAKILNNIKGYDISPDMVRLSLVNMYLHGFNNPAILEHDTLTSEEYWDNSFDLILANPPFMSPKGGIKPNNLFSLKSKRSEVLFTDYIIEHLTPQGKAAIVIPEGILFVEQNDYKKLRLKLVEDNYLYAIISLPHGVFKPYASVKTHILLIDRKLAKKTNEILFIDINSDGFTQSDTRLPVNDNDLPLAVEILKKYRNNLKENIPLSNELITEISYFVPKSKIISKKNYSLIGRWYKIELNYKKHSLYPFYKVSELCDVLPGLSPNMKTEPGQYTLVVPAEERKSSDHFSFDNNAVCVPLVSSAGHGKAAIKRLHYQEGKFALADTMCCLIPKNKDILNPKFLFEFLSYNKDSILVPLMCGATNVTMKIDDIKEIYISLPPLNIQNEIVLKYSIEKIEKKICELNFLISTELNTDFYLPKLDYLNELTSYLQREKIKLKSISNI